MKKQFKSSFYKQKKQENVKAQAVSCSLRLDDPKAQVEFTEHLQRQTQARAKILNPTIGVLCLLSLFGAYQSKNESSKRVFV